MMHTQWILDSLTEIMSRKTTIPARTQDLTDEDRAWLRDHLVTELVTPTAPASEELISRLLREVTIGVLTGLAKEAVFNILYPRRSATPSIVHEVEEDAPKLMYEANDSLSEDITLSLEEEKLFEQMMTEEKAELKAIDFSNEAEAVIEHLQMDDSRPSSGAHFPRELKEVLGAAKDEIKSAAKDYFHASYERFTRDALRQRIKMAQKAARKSLESATKKEIKEIRRQAKVRVKQAALTKIKQSKYFIFGAVEFAENCMESGNMKEAAIKTSVAVAQDTAIEKFCHVIGSVVSKVAPQAGKLIIQSGVKYFEAVGMLMEPTTTGKEADLYPPTATVEEIKTVLARTYSPRS